MPLLLSDAKSGQNALFNEGSSGSKYIISLGERPFTASSIIAEVALLMTFFRNM